MAKPSVQIFRSNNMGSSWGARIIDCSLFVFCSALIILFFLESAMTIIERSHWRDPIEHNIRVLGAKGLVDLSTSLPHIRQPIFDFLLRAYVWFPLLGISELSLRLPDLFFGIAVLLTSLYYLRRFIGQESTRIWALTLSSSLTLFIASRAPLIFYSTEGRHYSLCAWISILLFGHHYLSTKEKTSRSYRVMAYVIALLALNTHFFFFPFVGILFGLDICTWAKEKNLAWALKHLGVFVFIFLFSVAVNHETMFFAPPMERSAAVSTFLVEAWHWTKVFYSSWMNYSPLLLFAIFILLLWRCVSRRQTTTFLLVAGIFVFVFLAYLRFKSGYSFKGRYFFPFFGIHFVAMAMATQMLAKLVQNLAYERIPRRYSRLTSALALSALIIAIGSIILSRWSWLHVPSHNFTAEYLLFDQVKQSNKNRLVVYERELGSDLVPEFYLNTLSPTSISFVAAGKMMENGIELPKVSAAIEQSHNTIQQFVKPPFNGVVFFWRSFDTECHLPVDSLSHLFRITATHNNDIDNQACGFILDQYQSSSDIRRAAELLGFDISYL